MGPQGSPPAEPTHDGDVQRVLDAIRRIFRSVRVFSRGTEKSVGLSAAQLFVLQNLSCVGAASLGEVAKLTHTDQSSVSVVVSRLVRRGLVRRVTSGADARRLELSLTKRGEGLLKEAPPPFHTALMQALHGLQDTERGQLATLLERVVHDAGIADEQPAMLLEGDEHGDKAPRRRRRQPVKQSPVLPDPQ